MLHIDLLFNYDIVTLLNYNLLIRITTVVANI